MTEPRRRRTLTPFDSELRFAEPPRAHRAGPLARLRRRRRQPPTTFRGAIAVGLLRLAVVVAVASGVALLLDHFTGRPTPFGFYVVGAFVLFAGFLTSSGNVGMHYRITQSDREGRVSRSFSYLFAGIAILAVAVTVDALSS
jgi:hypothetical protein